MPWMVSASAGRRYGRRGRLHTQQEIVRAKPGRGQKKTDQQEKDNKSAHALTLLHCRENPFSFDLYGYPSGVKGIRIPFTYSMQMNEMARSYTERYMLHRCFALLPQTAEHHFNNLPVGVPHAFAAETPDALKQASAIAAEFGLTPKAGKRLKGEGKQQKKSALEAFNDEFGE